MPAAIALADVAKSVSAVSFGDLDLGANHEGVDVSLTPPESVASGHRAGRRLEERLRCFLRGSRLGREPGGRRRVLDSAGKGSNFRPPQTPAALVLTDVAKIVSNVSFGDLERQPALGP